MLAALLLTVAAVSSGGVASPASAAASAGVLVAQHSTTRVIDAQQQTTTVGQAFDLLMDEFVQPLGSATLLLSGLGPAQPGGGSAQRALTRPGALTYRRPRR